MNDNSAVKFRLLESAIQTLQRLGENPLRYCDEHPGLILRNLGPEVEIMGRNKFVAYGEVPTVIRTGIRLVLPPGSCAFFSSEPAILGTSLICRNIAYYGSTEEILVSFFNLGELDIKIPTGAILPVRMFVSTPANFKLVSDLEYLEAVSEDRGN